jgi:Family of unknown function (DUF6600)
MKTGLLLALGMTTAIVCLVGIGAGQDPAPAEPPSADVNVSPGTDTPASMDTTPDVMPDVASAPVAQAAPETPPALPPDIDPSSPLAHVISLAQAGISESVILTYVTNSASPFNLDAEKIIYLRDVGLPDEVVTAMIDRDQVLQTETTATALPPPQPAAPTETVESTEAPPTEVTVNYFYDTLAPYGTWIDVQGYGRCWRPSVVVYSPTWQPYCDNGHWIYTDSGWYWVSDYSWGWETFHYGRWLRDARFGWCWYPGTVWGPAWVTWRYSDDYCGWAPLPPFANFVAGVGFTYRGAAVSVGFGFGLHPDCFTFVPASHFCDPHPWHYRVATRDRTRIFDRTRILNDFSVNHASFINRGIPAQHIANLTHRPIQTVAIRETSSRMTRAEEFDRDGRTLFVQRPGFKGQPRPFPGETVPSRTAPPARRMVDLGTPPRHGAVTEGQNQLPPRAQPAANQPRNENNQPHNWQPATREPQPARPPQQNVTGQPQMPRITTVPGPSQRIGAPVTRQPSPTPVNRGVPGAAIQTPRTDSNPPNRADNRPAWSPPAPVNRGAPGAAIQTPRANFNPPNRTYNPPAWPPGQQPLQTPRETGRFPERQFSQPTTVSPPAQNSPAAENRRPVTVERPPAAQQPVTRRFDAPRNDPARMGPPPAPARPERSAPPAATPSHTQPTPAPSAPPARSQQSDSGRDKNQKGRQ